MLDDTAQVRHQIEVDRLSRNLVDEFDQIARAAIDDSVRAEFILRSDAPVAEEDGASAVGATEVRYHYVCAGHGTVASAPVTRNVPAAAIHRCPFCGSATETWVGTSPPEVETAASILDMPVRRAG